MSEVIIVKHETIELKSGHVTVARFDSGDCLVTMDGHGLSAMYHLSVEDLIKFRDTINLVLKKDVIEESLEELQEADKPSCFGCFGYRACVNKTTPPSNCPWECRCYNSQRDQ